MLLTILKCDIALDDNTLDKLDRSLDSQALGVDQRRRSLSQCLHLVYQLVVFVIKLDQWAAWYSQHNCALLSDLWYRRC